MKRTNLYTPYRRASRNATVFLAVKLRSQTTLQENSREQWKGKKHQFHSYHFAISIEEEQKKGRKNISIDAQEAQKAQRMKSLPSVNIRIDIIYWTNETKSNKDWKK